MIAIISDIHDNLVNLAKLLQFIKTNKINEVICLGDITNEETFNKLATGYNGKIHIVRGNADFFDEDLIKNFPNIKNYGEWGELAMNDKNIAFVHKPVIIKKLLDKQKYDYIFYGHTHKPWQEKKDNTIILNPGTLGGMFSRSTFAVWDVILGKFKLILVDELR